MKKLQKLGIFYSYFEKVLFSKPVITQQTRVAKHAIPPVTLELRLSLCLKQTHSSPVVFSCQYLGRKTHIRACRFTGGGRTGCGQGGIVTRSHDLPRDQRSVTSRQVTPHARV